jgi:uncharacterized protein YjcR
VTTNYSVERKLTVDQVLKIREMYADGAKRPVLARMFGVSHVTIHKIIHRHTWKRAEDWCGYCNGDGTGSWYNGNCEACKGSGLRKDVK